MGMTSISTKFWLDFEVQENFWSRFLYIHLPLTGCTVLKNGDFALEIMLAMLLASYGTMPFSIFGTSPA